ncbi:2'-5' RNA ligase [Seinonella peptonophila]|uniref:2'-5' RNA ligase n=1 Tax=Seinonella peptonophila TaxID=112248 RepID=A0A1M4XJT9_9BACL|nr:2'-5' RNA ligase family protein [Seinonella peptonophila]SHE93917.1 2'-5' RNA ligase [Seinonella peptonophila]
MIKRAINLFLPFSNTHQIQEWRKRYDPLYALIPPHITLVFPFESEHPSSLLKKHVQQIAHETSSFSIQLQGITGTIEQYLFLRVVQGNDLIIHLHDDLYTSVLLPYLNRQYFYAPHVTVGRFEQREAFKQALIETEGLNQVFQAKVDRIYVEQIDHHGKSIIESVIFLAD